jgi:hypothetical protein
VSIFAFKFSKKIHLDKGEKIWYTYIGDRKEGKKEGEKWK